VGAIICCCGEYPLEIRPQSGISRGNDCPTVPVLEKIDRVKTLAWKNLRRDIRPLLAVIDCVQKMVIDFRPSRIRGQ
jgi:hypothetical protein